MDAPHHRRDFVRGLGLTALAAPAVLADDTSTRKADDAKPADAPAPKPPTEAEARMQLVLARYGKQLDEPARRAVRREIDAITARAEALRKFALDNGDGPFPVFHPYRAPLAEPKG